jgi:hypothetical protein
VLANGVLYAPSTGENTVQVTGTGAKVIYSGQKLSTNQERAANTPNAELYALDARTGKLPYRRGVAMTTSVHFGGLAAAEGQTYAVDFGSNLYCFGLKGPDKS